MRSRSFLIAGWLALARLSGDSSAAERPWLEVNTPHFVIVANTGEGDARDAGWQFEQVSHVFATLWPWARRESGRPFVVFVLRSERDLKALAPKYWEDGRDGTIAVAVAGADKDYVALRSGVSLERDPRTNPYYYAYWGYAIRVLDSSFPVALPPWFQRGLADLFGNTLVRQKDVHVGRLITHHLEPLSQFLKIPLPELLAANWRSKYVTDEAWRRFFDAEAWILLHYLVFGEEQAHLPKFNRFADLLRQGHAPEPAFREAFGELEPLAKGLNRYIGRRLYNYAAIKVDLNVKAEGFTVRSLPSGEAAALRAGFHIAMNRPAEARALLEEARRMDPHSPLPSEGEALLLDREDKREQALAAYALAAQRGSDNFYVHYRRAALMRRRDATKETLAQAAKALERAVELNPDHAWSQASLARVLSELEPGARAVEAAKKAVSLEPSVTGHRLALIDALWSASRPDEARREAQAALALAVDDEDRQDIQKRMDSMQPARVHYERGRTYSRERDYAKAKAELDKAIALDPTHAEALWERGVANELLGHYEEAIADYTRAIELKPDYATAYFRRGITYGRAGNLEQALADYDRAIEVSPNFAAVYVSRAGVHERRGSLESALADYSKAIELFGEKSQYPVGEIYYFRGRIYGKLGNVARAVQDLEKAQSLPNDDRGAEIEALLAELKVKR